MDPLPSRPPLPPRHTHTVDATNIEGDLVTLSAPFTSGAGLFGAEFYLPDLGFTFQTTVTGVDDDKASFRIGRHIPFTPRLEQITLTTPSSAWPGVEAKTNTASIGQEPLAVGASPDATADNGGTALGAAAQSGNGELVRVLVDTGADLDKADDLGWTPLMWAAERNESSDVLRALVDACADVDARHEQSGATALMRGAFWSINVDIILTLLEAGADPHTRDHIGMTRGFNGQHLTEQGLHGRHRQVEAMRVIGER